MGLQKPSIDIVILDNTSHALWPKFHSPITSPENIYGIEDSYKDRNFMPPKTQNVNKIHPGSCNESSNNREKNQEHSSSLLIQTINSPTRTTSPIWVRQETVVPGWVRRRGRSIRETARQKRMQVRRIFFAEMWSERRALVGEDQGKLIIFFFSRGIYSCRRTRAGSGSAPSPSSSPARGKEHTLTVGSIWLITARTTTAPSMSCCSSIPPASHAHTLPSLLSIPLPRSPPPHMPQIPPPPTITAPIPLASRKDRSSRPSLASPPPGGPHFLFSEDLDFN